MKVRTLQADDGERLLTFELANRAWFEQHVEARSPAFYSRAGVGAHIAEYLDSFNAGAMHPCVLTSDDGSTWTIIVSMPNGTSCLLAAGENWQPVERVAQGPQI